MPARTRYRLAAAISSNPNNEEKDLGNVVAEVVCDKLGDGGTWTNVLATSATNIPVQLTQVANARFIVVRAFSADPNLLPGNITIKKNVVGGEAWTIAPMPDTKEAHFMICTDGITALFLSNLSTTVAMRVIISMAGD